MHTNYSYGPAITLSGYPATVLGQTPRENIYILSADTENPTRPGFNNISLNLFKFDNERENKQTLLMKI